MTNFALYHLIKDLGYSCIFVDIPDRLWPTSKLHRDPLFVTRRFGYKYFNITSKYKNRIDLKKLNDIADTFIVGSDQLWNYTLCKSAGNFFYLDFVYSNKKRISYGTSFGHEYFNGNSNEKMAAGFYLNLFDAVSVREDYAVDLCKNEFGIEAFQVLDPVFMCAKKHYLKCIDESSLSNEKQDKYLLAYILDPTEDKQIAIEYVANKLGLNLICIPNAHVKNEMRTNWRLPIKEDIDVEDWLYYFYNAEMVITDSFHGGCFSIIFEKQFISIGNSKRGLMRFYSLFKALELLDQFVLSPKEILNNEALLKNKIDYNSVNIKLHTLRNESMNWLKNALSVKPKSAVYSSYDLLDERIDQMTKQLEKKINELNKLLKQEKQNIEQLNDILNGIQNTQQNAEGNHHLFDIFKKYWI